MAGRRIYHCYTPWEASRESIYTVIHTQGGYQGRVYPVIHTQGGYQEGTPCIYTPREATRRVYPCIYTPREATRRVNPCIYTPREARMVYISLYASLCLFVGGIPPYMPPYVYLRVLHVRYAPYVYLRVYNMVETSAQRGSPFTLGRERNLCAEWCSLPHSPAIGRHPEVPSNRARKRRMVGGGGYPAYGRGTPLVAILSRHI